MVDANEEADSDVIEVVSISSDSDVFSLRPSLDSLASVFLVIVTEFMCVPCGPQHFVSQVEEYLRYKSRKQRTPKAGNDMRQHKGRSLLMRGSGRSACERIVELGSPAGAPKWILKGMVLAFGYSKKMGDITGSLNPTAAVADWRVRLVSYSNVTVGQLS